MKNFNWELVLSWLCMLVVSGMFWWVVYTIIVKLF